MINYINIFVEGNVENENYRYDRRIYKRNVCENNDAIEIQRNEISRTI